MSTVRFDAGSVGLAADRWPGDGSRPADVVLLHGGGQTRHSWKGTAERLAADGWGVVAVDLRGHGDSDWHPQQDYTLSGLVEDLLAVVALLDVPPVLVGASLGGYTALAAAGENPVLASGLVLVDVVVNVEPAGVRRVREFMTARPDGFATLEEAAARIAIPTLIVRGLCSDVVSAAGVDDMLVRIPLAQVVEVATAGHMVAGDENDPFAAALAGFLDRLTYDALDGR